MKNEVIAVAALMALYAGPSFAAEPTPAEEKYCAHDYRQYCNEDGLGSQLLAICMRQHGKELSAECIKALEDAGEVTHQEEAELEKMGK